MAARNCLETVQQEGEEKNAQTGLEQDEGE